MTFKAKALALLAVLMLALFVVACGGGDDDDTPNPTQSNGNNATATTDNSGDDTGDDDDSGDDDEDTAGDGDIDACALLSQDEVGELIEEPSEGYLTIDGSTASCYWESTVPVSAISIVPTTLIVVDRGTFDEENLLGGEPVDGIGDAAVWSGGTLNFIAGEYDVQVYYQPGEGVSEEDYMNTTKAVAQKVLDRLP